MLRLALQSRVPRFCRGAQVAIKDTTEKPLSTYQNLSAIAAQLAPVDDECQKLLSKPIAGYLMLGTAAYLSAYVDGLNFASATPPHIVEFKKKYSAMADVGSNIAVHWGKALEAAQLRDAEQDADVKQLAADEIVECFQKVEDAGASSSATECLEGAVRNLADAESFESTWTLEVSGRAGGVEASLFADELFETYLVYARKMGWNAERLTERGAAGGQQARLSGDGVFWRMMHELGTHRVQRVPVTEASGRMQTSTCAVTMLPELEKTTVAVLESDCEIEMTRGSGPGGQGVNSSSNAVRLKHKPSGITVFCHESRSGVENRIRAMRKVAQQLWKSSLQNDRKRADSLLAKQWVSGERGERLRTYNYPQGRINDHRVKEWTCNTVDAFMKEAQGVEELHDMLTQAHFKRSLPIAAEAEVAEMLRLCQVGTDFVQFAKPPKAQSDTV